MLKVSRSLDHFIGNNAMMSAVMLTVVLTVVLAVAPTAPLLAQQPAAQPPATAPATPKQSPLPMEEVRIFAQVLNQVREAYVEPIDDKTLLENAIKGMLAGIDPHSTYLAKDDFNELQETTTGEFGGLGVEVGIENGLIKIIAPMDDSPAARAGIQAGDLIIKLDDRPTQEVTLGDTTELLRGPPGSKIRLTIMRQGSPEPIEVTVTREIIKARSVRYREQEPGYGYIRIAQFSANTGTEVVEALNKLNSDKSGKLKGLVLDLRNNPGGVLQSAVAVVDAFVTSGLIVYTEGRAPNSNMRFEATPDDPSHAVPLVVLINGGSASASEIVAGALQDLKRGIIMGTRSFGKGSVQTVLPLTNDRGIKLTTALYYTPNGRSIQAKGITPDIVVDRGQVTKIADNVAAYREEDLGNHLANGNDAKDEGKTESKKPAAPAAKQPAATAPKGKTSVEDVLVQDYQLNEALNLLKGLNFLPR